MNKFITFALSVVCILNLFLNRAIAQEVLTWQECIKEAAKNHPDLISAQASVKQSEAGKRIAASALFPQINSNLNASTAKTATSGSKGVTNDTYTYGVTGDRKSVV